MRDSNLPSVAVHVAVPGEGPYAVARGIANLAATLPEGGSSYRSDRAGRAVLEPRREGASRRNCLVMVALPVKPVKAPVTLSLSPRGCR